MEPLSAIAIYRKAKAIAKFCKTAVLFVSADPQLDESVYDVTYELDEGVHTFRSYYQQNDLSQFWQKPIKGIRFWKAHTKAYRLIEEKFGKPDILDLNVLSRWDIWTFYLWKRDRIPYTITERWSGFLPQLQTYANKGAIRKWWTEKLATNAARIITVSTYLKNNMEANGLKANYEVIPNVVDMPASSPPPHSMDEKILIANISVLKDHIKNISLLIRLVVELKKVRPTIELHIIGDGPDRDQLHQLAKDLGALDEFVYFHGMQSNKWVHDFFERVSFTAIASNFETFSIVPIESIANGRPVISTQCGGPNENIREAVGRLVPLDDESAYREALLYMIDHYRDYDPQLLYEYAVQHYSYEKVGQRYHQLFQEILGEI